MVIHTDIPPCEHDVAIGLQENDLVKRGLDSALKLSLLSEVWIMFLHGSAVGTVANFATRLGYADDLVRQGLDQLTQSGYLKRSCDNSLEIVYFLTDQAPRLETVRRLLSSWRDLRFYLRADSLIMYS
jgi:hypothetical protein